MARDFTMEAYADLLSAAVAADHEVRTVREYVTAADHPDRFLILRHDVDRKPENALAMARLEADHGVRSTYYWRTVEGTFRPGLIRAVAELGHEVGYHYEDVDRAGGDLDRARERFRRELRRLRAACPTPVETVCMHGNPLTPHDNRELWTAGSATFEEFDLLGEAYLSLDFGDVGYYSDTGRTWRDGPLKVKDTTGVADDTPVPVGTTAELAAALREGRLDRACVLTHPNRWAGSYPELLVEGAKDRAINLVKRGLALSERVGSAPPAGRVGEGDGV